MTLVLVQGGGMFCDKEARRKPFCGFMDGDNDVLGNHFLNHGIGLFSPVNGCGTCSSDANGDNRDVISEGDLHGGTFHVVGPQRVPDDVTKLTGEKGGS